MAGLDDELKIIVTAELDPNASGNIQEQLNAIKGDIDVTVKLKTEGAFDEIPDIVEKLKLLEEISIKDININLAFNKETEFLNDINKITTLLQTVKQFNDIDISIEMAERLNIDKIQKLADSLQNISFTSRQYVDLSVMGDWEKLPEIKQHIAEFKKGLGKNIDYSIWINLTGAERFQEEAQKLTSDLQKLHNVVEEFKKANELTLDVAYTESRGVLVDTEWLLKQIHELKNVYIAIEIDNEYNVEDTLNYIKTKLELLNSNEYKNIRVILNLSKQGDWNNLGTFTTYLEKLSKIKAEPFVMLSGLYTLKEDVLDARSLLADLDGEDKYVNVKLTKDLTELLKLRVTLDDFKEKYGNLNVKVSLQPLSKEAMQGQLRAIANMLPPIKVKVEFDEEGINLENLNKNIEALNKNWLEENDRLKLKLDEIALKYEELGDEATEQIRKEIAETNKLNTSKKHLLTTIERLDEAGNETGHKTEIYGNKNIQFKEITDDNNKHSIVKQVNYAGLEKEKESFFKLMTDIQSLEVDMLGIQRQRTNEEKEFLDLMFELEHKNGNYFDISKRLNELTDKIKQQHKDILAVQKQENEENEKALALQQKSRQSLENQRSKATYKIAVDREKLLKKVAENRAKALENFENKRLETIKKIQDLERKGFGESPLKEAKKALNVYDLDAMAKEQARVEKKGGTFNAQKYINEQIAKGNQHLDKAIDKEKALNLFRQKNKEFQERINALKRQGFDVEPLQKMKGTLIHNKKGFDALTKNVKEFNEELKKVEVIAEQNEKLDSFARKVTKLGQSVESTFSNIKGETETYNKLNEEVNDLLTDINNKIKDRTKLNETDFKVLEKAYQKIQDNAYGEKQRIGKETIETKETDTQADKLDAFARKTIKLSQSIENTFSKMDNAGESLATFNEFTNNVLEDINNKIKSKIILEKEDYKLLERELNAIQDLLHGEKLRLGEQNKQTKELESQSQKLEIFQKKVGKLGQSIESTFSKIEGAESTLVTLTEKNKNLLDDVNNKIKSKMNLKEEDLKLLEQEYEAIQKLIHAEKMRLGAEGRTYTQDEKLDKFIRKVEVLGNTFQKSFSKMDGGEESLLILNGLIDDLMTNINNKVEAKIEFTKKDFRALQKEYDLLKDIADIEREGLAGEKAELGQEKKLRLFEKSTNQIRKTYERIFKNLGAKPEEVEAFNEKILGMLDFINDKRELGKRLSQEELMDIQKRIDLLKDEGYLEQQRLAKIIADRKQQNKFRGDAIDPKVFDADEYQRAFDPDKSPLARDEEYKKLAKTFLEAQYGARNLDESLARLTTTQGGKFGQQIVTITYDYKNMNGEIAKGVVAIDELERQMYDLGNAGKPVKEVANVWDRLGDAVRNVGLYGATMSIMYGAMNQLRLSFQFLLELDTAMTDLIKVTEASKTSIAEFKEEAVDLGQKMGKSTVEVVQSVAEWQRLGKTLEDSKKLGEIALRFSVVGDTDIESATSFLISSLQGFNVAQEDAVKESERYIDIFNEVANDYAINSAGIGEALKRSASALHETGNSVEEAVALITVANEVIQDEQKVGTAFKTISLRLQGVNEETGKSLELYPELAKEFDQVGISLMNAEGGFRNTKEVLEDLGKIWKTSALNDLQRANLLELIAGKEQANVLAAVLNNVEGLDEVYQTAMNSMGSSAKEFEKTQDSLNFKVGQLKNSWEGFWLAVWDDQSVKNAVDGLNVMLQTMTKVIEVAGNMAVLFGVTLPIAVMMLDKEIRKSFMTKGFSFKEIAFGTKELGLEFEGLGRKAKQTGFALGNMFKVGLIGFGIGWGIDIAIGLITKLITMRERHIQKMQEEYDKQEQINNQLKNVDLERYGQLERMSVGRQLPQEELAEYQSLQQQIISASPEFIAYYDAEGNAITKTSDELKELNETRREELRLMRERLNAEKEKDITEGTLGLQFTRGILDSLGGVSGMVVNRLTGGNPYVKLFDELKTPVEKLEKYTEKIKSLKEDFNETSEGIGQLKTFKGLFSEEELKEATQNAGKMREIVKAFHEHIAKLKEEGKISETQEIALTRNVQLLEIGGNFDGFFNSLEEVRNKSEEALIEIDEVIKENQGKVGDTIAETGTYFEDELQSAIDELKLDDAGATFMTNLAKAMKTALESGDISDIEGDVGAWQERLVNAFVELEKLGVSQEDVYKGTDKSRIALQKLIKLYGEGTAEGETYRLLLDGMASGQNKVADALNRTLTLEEKRQELIAGLQDYADKNEDVYETINKLEKGEALELSTITDLIEAHPELTDALEEKNGVMTLNIKTLKQWRDEQEKAFKEEKRNQLESIQLQKQQLVAFVSSRLGMVKAEDLMTKASRDALKEKAYTQARAMALDKVAQASKTNPNMSDDDKMMLYSKWASAGTRNILYAIDEVESLMKYEKSLQAILNTDFTKNVGTISSGNKKTSDSYDVLRYVTDKFKTTLRNLDNQLLSVHSNMLKYPEYSKEYRSQLSKEISLINQKIKAYDEEEARLTKEIANKRITEAGLTSTTKGGKPLTAQEIKNEAERMKQAVEEAKDTLKSLNEQELDLRRQVIEYTVQMANISVQWSQQEQNRFENFITRNENLADTFKVGSERWQSIQKTNLGYMESQKKAIDESVKTLTDMRNDPKIRANPKEYADITNMLTQQLTAQTDIANKIFHQQEKIEDAIINNIIENYNNAIEESNEIIEQINSKMNQLDEKDSSGYIQYQQLIVQELKNQLNLNDKTLKNLLAQEETVKKFPERYEAWKDEVKGLKNEQQALFDSIIDAQKEIYDKQNQQIDELFDAYKDANNKFRDLELKSIDETAKAEDKLHDKRIKNYEENLEKFKEIADEQLKAIEKQEEERSYQQDLGKKQEERQDILDLIGLVSLDSSPQGRAKLKKLQEELKTITEDINEMQRKRQVEARKKALEEEVKAREKEQKSLKESEDERYKTEEERLEEHKKTIERKWENILEDERQRFADRQKLLQGHTTEMSKEIDSFIKHIEENSPKIGESISNNLIDKLNKARVEMLDISKTQNTLTSQFVDEYGKPKGFLSQDYLNTLSGTVDNLLKLSTTKMPSTTTQNVTINMNVAGITGGTTGATDLVNLMIAELKRRGVNI